MVRILAVLLLIAPQYPVFSQKQSAVRFGVNTEFGLNYHTSTFPEIEGVPKPAVPFDGGIGIGFTFGGIVDFQPAPNWRTGLNAGIERYGATLTGDESTVFTVNGTPVAGTIRHSLNAALWAISIRPTVSYSVGNAEIRAGISLTRIIAPDFEQRQEVTEPQGITLTSAAITGSLPDYRTMLVAPWISFSPTQYLLNENLTLAPSFRAEAGLSDIAGLSWRAWTLRAGISVFLTPPDKRQDTVPLQQTIPIPVAVEYDTIIVRDTATVESRKRTGAAVVLISRSISTDSTARRWTVRESYRRELPTPAPLLKAQAGVVFVRADGTVSANLSIDLQRNITKRFFPILPAVFFNLGESKIPEKYYNPPPSDKLLRYYSLLDTIARRMAVSPHATLTITAMLSGDSLDAIREMRTEKIQNYLRNRGNILPRQLQLRTTIITYPADPTLREEAERVIISSDDAAITAPMVYYDTIETSNPPVVRFLPNIISDEGVETWRLSVFSGGALVKEFSGQNDPPTEINWNLDDEKVLLHSRKPLIFELLATNYTGDTTISRTGEIRFVPDTTAIISGIEVFDALEYSIVFFDYNSSEIAQRDRASLMMLRRYCTQKTTEILGATDALGEEEYNRILSQKRAEAVAKIVGLPRSTARGLGSAGAEFSNDLPEGRMFNRRVRVSVSRRQ